MPIKISIIIPVLNGGESFRRCLQSIYRFLTPDIEVIVVVDGGTDGSGEIAKELGAQVIQLSETGGPARARNIGAKAAQGEILFFLDADVTIHSDTLNQVATIFQSQPDLAALIGSYDDAPGATNFLSQYKNLFHHYTHQTSNEAASTFWGACGAIRQTIFWTVGGFDPVYRYPSIEDIELGYRLKRAGYQIQLCKTVQVKHLKRWEVLSLLRAEIFYRALPWTELIWRDRQFVNDLNLSFSNRLSVVLTFSLLGAVVLGVWFPPVWLGAIAAGLALIVVNRSVYQFFMQKRSILFSLRVIPWHWFYFFYSGLVFAYGTINYGLRRQQMRA